MPDIGSQVSSKPSDFQCSQVLLLQLSPTPSNSSRLSSNSDAKVLASEESDGNVQKLSNKAWQIGINPFKIWREMHARGGGISQFYAGFDSHLAGRLGYLAIRNTLYKVIYDFYKPAKPFNDLTNR